MFMTTKEKFFNTLRNAVGAVCGGFMFAYCIMMFFMMWARPEIGKAMAVLFFIVLGIDYLIYEAHLRSLCHSPRKSRNIKAQKNVSVKANVSSLNHFLSLEVPNYTPAPATQPQFFDYEAHQ